MKILCPKAVHHLDRFYVVNGAGDVVQGEYTEDRANRAALILNHHEMRNGRASQYSVIPKP